MKRTASLFIILVSALLLAGWRAPIASNCDRCGTLWKIQGLQNRTCPPCRLHLVDRVDTQDSITYGTDPDAERAMQDQAREEKEKEDKAWMMLQHMYIDQNTGKRRQPAKQDNPPSQ